ncbi:MAG: hypothetical protein R3C30_09345 [Hyphomonadaceae bacterium]
MAEGGAAGWIGAIGSFVGGAAAVAGLFMAKPDLVTVVVPVTTLERVIERAQAEERPVEVLPTATQVADAPPAIPAQSLEGGVSASLLSLANTRDTIVANLRISNNSDAGVVIAARARGNFYAGDFTLSDVVGASCPLRRAANENFGTLPTAFGNPPINLANYTPVASGQSVTVTLIFQKKYCESLSDGARSMNLSGSFVVVQDDTARFASASFEGVVPASAN